MSLLLHLAREYCVSHIGLSAGYRADIMAVCRRCAAEVPQNGTIASTTAIAAWLQRRLDQGASPSTVARYRRVLTTVTRWGAERGLCTALHLPTIRVPPPLPEAWTVDQVSAILRAAAAWPGTVGRWPAGDWWLALLCTVYWTGARIGSLMAARPQDWDSRAACLMLRHTKNRRAAVYRLHPQAATAIDRIHDPAAERLFAWPYHRNRLFIVCRRIVQAAGVPCPRSSRFGLFHRLRRTCLSYCWAADPAIAQRQADHSSPQVTLTHYVDPRIVLSMARCAADVLPVPRILCTETHYVRVSDGASGGPSALDRGHTYRVVAAD